MRIAIAGGTGFIGSQIATYYVNQGHEVLILTRKKKAPQKGIQYIQWLNHRSFHENHLEDLDVFINLAGASINRGHWTKKHKRQIYKTRMTSTDTLIQIFKHLDKKPKVFINASAIGIYPSSQKKVYTEQSEEYSDDFLGKTVMDWEQRAKQAEYLGIRTVFIRLGVVLGKDKGALPLMVLPYKLFVGGRIGSGTQWVSWIHIDDVVKAISFIVENEQISGAVNVVSPHPVTMNEFGQTISRVCKRPHWFPVPSFLLKILLGEKSKLVLEGQHVLPKLLMKEGLQFKFTNLHQALKDLL